MLNGLLEMMIAILRVAAKAVLAITVIMVLTEGIAVDEKTREMRI